MAETVWQSLPEVGKPARYAWLYGMAAGMLRLEFLAVRLLALW